MSAVLAFVLLTAIIVIISIMAGAVAKLVKKNRMSCMKRYSATEANAYASLPSQGQSFRVSAPAYPATNALALEWNPDYGSSNNTSSTLDRQYSNVKPTYGPSYNHHRGAALKREHTWPSGRSSWDENNNNSWGGVGMRRNRITSNERSSFFDCRSSPQQAPHRRAVPRPAPAPAPKTSGPKIEEIITPEEKKPKEKVPAAAITVPFTFTPSISLPEAMWGFGTLMDRFLRKTNTKGVDALPPLDYEGLFFMLQGVTTSQVLHMILCLEAMVFMDVTKHTNRVWTLVLKYYVENTTWTKDERIPSIPASLARAKYKEADKLVLAWHLFERQCVERLEKYFDPEERMKALKQAEICLPRKDTVVTTTVNMDVNRDDENSKSRLNSVPLVREDFTGEALPDAKRSKRDDRAAMRTPPPSREAEKKCRSPTQVCEEPSPKRKQVDGDVDLVPAEYTYRSIEGELRVFTIQKKDDGLVFTQTSKSCTLSKSGEWYAGDLGQGYRVRLQAVGEKGKTGGAYIVDIQFAPGPKKRFQQKLTATSTK